MNRTQRVLALVLAIQIVLSAVMLWPRTARTGVAATLFPDLKTADVVAMTVTDNEGKTVKLRQVNGSWVLPEIDDYPAKGDKITPELDKIVALDTRRLVTRTSASEKRLQVGADSFLRRVDLETAAGAKYTLYLGSSPSYGATHVRAEGSDNTYLTSNLTSYEFYTTPASWVDSAYLSVAQDQLSTVVVQNAKGTLTFNHDSAGNWALAELPAGEKPATDVITQAVDRAASVTLLKPLGKANLPEYGLDRPLAVVTLQQKDGQTTTLWVGAQDPTDQSYAVRASTSQYHVRVSQYGLKVLVENGISDFVAPNETPTAQP